MYIIYDILMYLYMHIFLRANSSGMKTNSLYLLNAEFALGYKSGEIYVTLQKQTRVACEWWKARAPEVPNTYLPTPPPPAATRR